MPDSSAFPALFERLKKILQAYEPNLVVTENTPASYSLNTPFSKKFNKEVFFGAVIINKNYVSFHLMPIYIYPDLLKDLSAGLKKRMQGKSCFNFKTPDEVLLAELEQLTRDSVARVKAGSIL